MKKTFVVIIAYLLLLNNSVEALPTQVHAIISYEASRIPGIPTEIDTYLGSPDIVPIHDDYDDDIVEGAYDEDWNREPFNMHVWGPHESMYGWGTHFWDPSFGPLYGQLDYITSDGILVYINEDSENAFQRAQKLYMFAKASYPNYPADAFYCLGEVAHLLEDMATPAHVHCDAHVWDWIEIGDDSYENFLGIYDTEEKGAGRAAFESDYSLIGLTFIDPESLSEFDAPPLVTIHEHMLFRLFNSMAQKTAEWDSDDADGTGGSGIGGGSLRYTVDGLTEISDENCERIANVLMPKVLRHVAGLYILFARDVGIIGSYELTGIAGAHGSISPTGTSTVLEGSSEIFYAYPDPDYVVDKWYVYVNGQLVTESNGGTSYTLSNIQQNTTILVTFKQAPQPASLTIITPTAGDYARGYRMYIGWQTTGLTGNVKIELFQNGALYDVIEDSVSATVGKYTWNMSYDIPVGDNYTIKISSLSLSVAGESEAFSIVDVSQSASPIEIHNISEFQAVSSDQVINGRVYSPTAHYVLVNDIDASSVTNFVPIGIGGDHYRFSGIFDGKNYKIINIKIDRTDEVVGIFKVLMDDGTIKNLTLERGSIRGKGIVGALIGESIGTVINCHSSARVRTIVDGATSRIGGLIGSLNQGTLLNSSTYYYDGYSEVTSDSDEVGGLVGLNGGIIKWCWSACERADGENMVRVGGIAGFNSGVIEESYTQLTLETRGESHVGGVVGSNMGTVKNCYCGSKVRGETGYNTGGIVGNNDGGTVEKCYNYGPVMYSGGGGLIGRNYGSGLNSFWDTATSGVSQPVGSGNGVTNCYGLPTCEMKQQITYTSAHSADWDFDNIWIIDEGVDYPRLRGAKPCLAVPTDIVASNGQPGKITITWDSVADAGAYRVYRSDSSDGVFNPITTWLAGSLLYQDTAVIADVSFYYKVKAAYTINGAGESEFSNSDEGMCTFQLPCPTNVTATTDLQDFVLVQWDSVSGAGYYRVYRCESELGTKTAVTSWTDSLSFVDSTAEPDVVYYYWVTAAADISGTGQSDYAGPAIGKRPAPPNPDLNGDGFVNFEDFAILASHWRETCSEPDYCEGADYYHDGRVDLSDLSYLCEHWLTGSVPLGMVWVYINDPGIGGGHEGFTGYMSKYETTNAQYCEFLNAALASGDIIVDGNDVIGLSGANSGEIYYDLAGAGYNYCGVTGGGAARINYSGGVFNVDPGFENHPVTYVSWYGATAFCNYYGYRLPTEWEWQAVADHTVGDPYTYGCGTSINNSIANYYGSSHPNGTTEVGAFGTYGYGMCDMAGNVWEWTSSIYEDIYYGVRGGSGATPDWNCTVSYQGALLPPLTTYDCGFRISLDF